MRARGKWDLLTYRLFLNAFVEPFELVSTTKTWRGGHIINIINKKERWHMKK